MPYEPVESKRVYQRAEAIADQFWEIIVAWEWFAKRTVGLQLAKAADSIGANIAEAGGRFRPNDVRIFFITQEVRSARQNTGFVAGFNVV